MAITPQEINCIKIQLKNMSESEIDQIIQYAKSIITVRKEQLREEMWNNVREAIGKYCDATGDDIECRHPYEDGVLCLESLNNPGVLYIAT